MNYLKNNLHNSRALPYDIMKIISEYAEPYFLKQIENKDYDLDEIMYIRMRKIIIEKPMCYSFISEVFDKEINIQAYKMYLLQEQLREYKNKKICGVSPSHNIESRKYKMMCDLEHAKIYKTNKKNYNKYQMKNVYKKWLKL